MTKEEILIEFAKCLRSEVYAIKRYLKVYDQTQGGFVDFKLFPKQEEIIESFKTHRHNIVAKPRQAGISTTTQAFLAIKATLASRSKPETILIIANKLTLAKKFTKGIKDFINQLPRWMFGAEFFGTKERNKKDIFETNSQTEMTLAHNGTKIIAVATSGDALRGYSPTYLVFDEAAFIDNGEEVYSAAMSSLSTGGKAVLISCVTKDTFVFTDKGIKEVGDFVDPTKSGGYEVPSYNVLGKDITRQGHLFKNNGFVETRKIISPNSYLEGSLEHKVFAYDGVKYDWVKFRDLTTNHKVSVQYGANLWGNNDDVSDFNPQKSNRLKNLFKPSKITKDIAYLLGLYLTEGSSYKKYSKNVWVGGNINITCCDDLSETFINCGLPYSCHDGLHYTISSKQLYEFFEYLGFDLTLHAKDKIIPSRLMEMSRDNMIALLQGIFDGDGFSRADKGTIGIGLSSKRFIEQIRIILNNFGILASYQEVLTRPTKKVNVESLNYRLELSKNDSKIYYNDIGFRFKRKTLNENHLTISNNFSPTDLTHNSLNWLRDLKTRLGFTWVELTKNLNISCKFQKDLSRPNMLKIKKYLLDNYLWVKTDEDELMLDIISENLKWQPITSIIEGENETFDFSLPETNDMWCHSVIYNGMLGHQTPNGFDPVYYEVYKESIQHGNTNGFNTIEMRWYQDPRFNKDLEWVDKDGNRIPEDDLIPSQETFDLYEEKIRSGLKPTSTWYREMSQSLGNNRKKIAQELDVSFIGSGGTVVDDEFIMMQETENVMDPLWVDNTWWDGSNNRVYIWEEPELDGKYILSADVASGNGSDFSTFSIINALTMNQAVEFQGKLQPDKFAEIINTYGLKYNAYVVVDNVGVGASTVLKLANDYNYPNLHYDEVTPKALSNKTLDISRGNKIAGFNISGVRVQVISHMEEMVRKNIIKIRSPRVISELRSFIYKNGRPDHADGRNDDCLMALAMGLWILESSFKKLEKVNKQAVSILVSWATNTTPIDSSVLLESQRSLQEKRDSGQTQFDQFCGWANTSTINKQQRRGDYDWLFPNM